MGDAALERRMDQVDRLGARDRLTIGSFKTHAAIAQSRNFKSAEFTRLHNWILPRMGVQPRCNACKCLRLDRTIGMNL